MPSATPPPSDNGPGVGLVDRLVQEAFADLPDPDTGTAGIEVDAAHVDHSLGVLAGLIDGAYSIGFHSPEAERRYREAARLVRQAARGVAEALDRTVSPAASVAILLRMAGSMVRAYGLDRRLCARLAEHFLEANDAAHLSTPMLTQLGEALARSDRGPR